MGFQNGLYAFTAAVLGGIGNIPGAVLGGMVIGLVRSLGSRLRRRGVERGADLRHPDRDPGLPAHRPARRPHPGEGMSPRRRRLLAGSRLRRVRGCSPFLPWIATPRSTASNSCRCSSTRSWPGPERRRRLHRAVPPRHRGVLRHRRVHRGHPDRPASSRSSRASSSP